VYWSGEAAQSTRLVARRSIKGKVIGRSAIRTFYRRRARYAIVCELDHAIRGLRKLENAPPDCYFRLVLFVKNSTLCALFFAILPACADDGLDPFMLDDEAGDTGFDGQLPCVDLPEDFPSAAVDCRALACAISDDADEKLMCSAVLYIPEGEDADFALATSSPGSDLPWNELPWNAEAGSWENAEMVGIGLTCGYFNVNTSTILPGSDGARYVELVCSGAGFATSRVYLTDEGPVIAP
jgi:hypothetical protein